jgi:hypothetical protein
LQLADDMASIVGYISDIEQFARISQLEKAMEDVHPLIEDTTNFILRYTSRSGISIYRSPEPYSIDSNFSHSCNQGVCVLLL